MTLREKPKRLRKEVGVEPSEFRLFRGADKSLLFHRKIIHDIKVKR
jgi:hypothetical protein